MYLPDDGGLFTGALMITSPLLCKMLQQLTTTTLSAHFRNFACVNMYIYVYKRVMCTPLLYGIACCSAVYPSCQFYYSCNFFDKFTQFKQQNFGIVSLKISYNALEGLNEAPKYVRLRLAAR